MKNLSILYRNKLNKKVLGVAISMLMTFSSFNAQAFESYLHGTNCNAANVLQAAKFFWNKKGVTNIGTIPLYVICPIALDQDVLATFATPRVFIFLSEHMAGSNTSSNCIGRIYQATEPVGPNPSADQVLLGAAVIPTVNDFAPNGDIDNSAVLLNASTGTHVTANILCLVQPGSSIRSYGARILD